MAQNGPKWPQNRKKIDLQFSARNALKWHPNGLKRYQNTFLWPFDPLLAALGWFPPAFDGSQGPKRAAKMGRKWATMAKNGHFLVIPFSSIFRPFSAHLRPFAAHFCRPFWALLGPWEPSKAGGNRPRAAKGGSKGHINVFWYRFRPFGCHFSAFRAETEDRKFFDFEVLAPEFC